MIGKIFNLAKKKMQASLISSFFHNQKSLDYRSIDEIEDVKNSIALRVVDKISSYTIANGFKVNFEGHHGKDTLNNEFDYFCQKLKVKERLLEAVRRSLAYKKGAVVYFCGGLLEEEIKTIEGINCFNAAYTMITDPKKKAKPDLYNTGYHDLELKAYVGENNASYKIIDPSRYAIINLFPNKELSYLQKIMPFSDIVEGLIMRADKVLSVESGLLYKSSTHNTKDGEELKEQFKEAMYNIKNNLNEGNVGLIPAVDDLKNFTITTSIDKVFQVMKDVYSAITGVPKSILFGEEKSGLNTGQGKQQDVENFMRDIRGFQQLQIKPIIEKLIKVFLKGKDTPYSIAFTEPSPYDEKTRMEIDKLYNDGLAVLVAHGIIVDTEARKNVKGISL